METPQPVLKQEILVVDDTPENLNLLSQMLFKAGYQVRAARNGPRALESVQTALPDMILLDVMMPDMDGYTVCRYLKEDERTRNIPIIFISALDNIEAKVKAFTAGGVDFISKPLQIQEVLARVRTHLALRNASQELQQKNDQLLQQISERQRAEDMLRNYADRLRIMSEIDQSILAARSPESIATVSIGRIRSLMNCQRALVLEIKETGEIQKLAAESSGQIPLQVDAAIYQELFDLEPIQRGQVQGIEDLDTRPQRSHMQQALYEQGVRSYIIIPLHVHRELFGTLHLEADHPRAFTANQINAAIEVCALLAVAIRQVRLHEQVQKELVERKRAEAALRQRTLELEARNAELDAFAHTVAHDLKNPLTSLIGFIKLLHRRCEKLSIQQIKENLERIGQNAQKMHSIINELLLLSSVRKMEDIKTEPLDMAAITAEAQDRLNDQLVEHHAQLTMAQDWPIALGYAPWIEEVWVNYISNAIKYGGQPPQIEIGGEMQSTNTVHFWVRDNGQGLTPEQQERLFTQFERLDQVQAKGHGLGLSIVRRIVEKLGGEAGVQSQVQKGSVFWFTLPAQSKKQNQTQPLTPLHDKD